MQSIRNPLLLTAVLGLSLSSYSHAGTDSGLYLGGSIGSASLDYSDDNPELGGFDDIKFDDSDTAFKLFAGFNFGILPLLDLAVEGGYVNFGTQTGLITGGAITIPDSDSEVDGWNGFGLLGFNLGPVGLFGKVGFVAWDVDVKNLDDSFSDSGTDPAYGIGAKIQLGSFQIRAEYEMYDIDPFDIDYYSIGGAYVF